MGNVGERKEGKAHRGRGRERGRKKRKGEKKLEKKERKEEVRKTHGKIKNQLILSLP